MNYLVPVAVAVLAASAISQDAIRWSKAKDGALPKAAANDARPTILYFTFDT